GDFVGGERDRQNLAGHRHENCKRTEEEIARALQGTWRPEHLFALKQALQLYDFYQKQLRECEAQIEQCLRGMRDRSQGAALPPPPRPRRRKAEKNEERCRPRAFVLTMAGTA